ncbi:caspase domain-containing protein [Chytriomyces cf. hyalinus JEL632]|nr:caspase domain-containing protein [Chytriomyces cf. hyalinus JEL632]
MEGFLGKVLSAIGQPDGAPQAQNGQNGQQSQQQPPKPNDLPPGWVAQWSQNYGCYFYANQATGQTQWTPPAGSGGAPAQQQQHSAPQQQHSQQRAGEGSPTKKALLIGINYTGSKYALAGCINDAYNLKDFISQNYGYSTDTNHMVVMTDDAKDPSLKPTAKNLLAGFHWLLAGSKPGDELFLSYSGHGGQVKDQDGDRASGLDDTLCPVDFETAGQIISDDLHRYLVKALPQGVKLTCILDCCHSGTLLELPYTYRPDANGKMGPVELVKHGMKLVSEAGSLLKGGFSMSKMTDAKRIFEEARVLATSLRGEGTPTTEAGGYKQEAFNENDNVERHILSISGCRDDQTSADTSFDGRSSGALTYALLSTLKQSRQLTLEQLLASLRGFMATSKFSQIPQLATGMQVNPSSPFTL